MVGEIPDVLDGTIDTGVEIEPDPKVLEVLAAGVVCLSRAPFVGAFSDAASPCGGGGGNTEPSVVRDWTLLSIA